MNTTEEHALQLILGAASQTARNEAIRSMLRLPGIRMSSDMKMFLQRQREEVMQAAVLRSQPADKVMRRIEPGVKPRLDVDAESSILDWVDYWHGVATFGGAGLELPGPLLLHGPPGTGKTMTTRWIASLMTTRVTYLVDAYEVVDSHVGQTSANLSKRFAVLQEANVGLIGPALVLEEIDTMGASRSSAREAANTEMNLTTVSLMRLIEASSVPVVMTTNRVSDLDPALVRRCDAIVELAEPDLETRLAILTEIFPGAASLDMGRPFVDLVRDAKQMRRKALIAKVRAERESA